MSMHSTEFTRLDVALLTLALAAMFACAGYGLAVFMSDPGICRIVIEEVS